VVLVPVEAMSIATATAILASLAITSTATPSALPSRVTLHGFGVVTFKPEEEYMVPFLFLHHLVHLVHNAILVVPQGLHLHMAF